jgi:hypothetical protein
MLLGYSIGPKTTKAPIEGFWLNFGATLTPSAESVTVDGEQSVIARVVARSRRFHVAEHDLVREGLGRGGGRKEPRNLSRMRGSLKISTQPVLADGEGSSGARREGDAQAEIGPLAMPEFGV